MNGNFISFHNKNLFYAGGRVRYSMKQFDDESFIHNLSKLLLCIKVHMATHIVHIVRTIAFIIYADVPYKAGEYGLLLKCLLHMICKILMERFERIENSN